VAGGGKRSDGATAPGILPIMSKYVGQPPDTLKTGISYFDPDDQIDAKDVLHQIDWYKFLRFVKPEVDGNAIIDKGYVMPRPEK
jgi:hypothetical protein